MSCATSSRTTEHAARYARALLTDFGCKTQVPQDDCDHPALAWMRSGMLPLSGMQDAAPRMVPLPLASAADGALLALRALSPGAVLPPTGAQLLGERARLMAMTRDGRHSPTGHCRLIDCGDGRIALNLARPEDVELLPALVRGTANDWESLQAACAKMKCAELVQQGVSLGMPIARDELAGRSPWIVRERLGQRAPPHKRTLRVVDLSALWAGPLAASLLAGCGAEIVKVESNHRPDGAREGHADFYRLLNTGKRSVGLDYRAPQGRATLADLVETAEVVIEASRPRALRQLGIVAEDWLEKRSGRVWLRLLAHGDDPTRIGFGDDIGVAAGLPSVMEATWGEPYMVGDAIADPLSGLHAALATRAVLAQGGGELISISMRGVVRQAMGPIEDAEHAARLRARAREWAALVQDAHSDGCASLYPMRTPAGGCERLGQSNAAFGLAPC